MSTTIDSSEREQLVTTDDVAAALAVSSQAVRLWIRKGIVPALQTPGGRDYRIRKSTLDKLLQERPNPG